jgi:monofunctional chorismate mutase|tara:strand:- start:116 stop:487 length:372 start_codon:yes stop_codon:yes gene_type:complete
MSKIRGIRGATTVNKNTRSEVIEATQEMLSTIIDKNKLSTDDIAAAMFTTTEDINCEFPAYAARMMGWKYVALLDNTQMKVPNSLKLCIRVLLLVNTDIPANQLENVYLHQAINLRKKKITGF